MNFITFLFILFVATNITVNSTLDAQKHTPCKRGALYFEGHQIKRNKELSEEEKEEIMSKTTQQVENKQPQKEKPEIIDSKVSAQENKQAAEYKLAESKQAIDNNECGLSNLFQSFSIGLKHTSVGKKTSGFYQIFLIQVPQNCLDLSKLTDFMRSNKYTSFLTFIKINPNANNLEESFKSMINQTFLQAIENTHYALAFNLLNDYYANLNKEITTESLNTALTKITDDEGCNRILRLINAEIKKRTRASKTLNK